MNRSFAALFLLLLVSFSSYAQRIGGIGAQLFLDTAGGHTMPRIQSLVANSPADKYLHATDYIIKVNGTDCKDKTMEEVVNMIRGEEGSTVHVVVADTKQGDRPREYDLIRVGIQVGPQDPVADFYNECTGEVQQLTAKGYKVVKTFNSACGNYFFNFDALPKTYHVQVMAMQEKSSGANPGFYVTAKAFDNDHEADFTEIPRADTKELGQIMVLHAEGSVTFKKNCVGTVNVQLHDDATKCHAMYVVVYK